MSFLFPLYLLGIAALAVPVLLHLRRRPPKEFISFSSHLFLEKTPERLTRRTRLERWLLLSLRCLALLLLASAFGRPFFRSMAGPDEGASQTRAVILVDRSATMHRENLWDQAVAAAAAAIRRYRATDEVAFAFFDEDFDLAADHPAWASLGPGARVAAMEALVEERGAPSWLAADPGAAMTRAADLLLAADSDRPVGKREVVLISDFPGGASLEQLQSGIWPEEVEVLPVTLAVKNPGNLSLSLAATPARVDVEEAEVYRVRIRNAADSDGAAATLMWKGFPETAIEITVAPGTGRIVTSAPRPEGATRGTLVVAGDEHPFDNEVHLAPVQARPLRVLYLAEEGVSESAGSPLFYLRRALQPTPLLNPVVTAAERPGTEALESQEILVVDRAWSAETAELLNRFAETGGLVVAIPDAASDLAALAGEEGWALKEASPRDYALLANLDFSHPVLEPFARAGIRDFSKIRFWKHRELQLPEAPDPATRVIATFDDGSPALVEHRIGEGALAVFLSGWEPEESQLALSSKFVPLLFSFFEHGGFSIRSTATLYVGETNYLAPGFYEEESADGTNLVSVNLDPSIGDTAPFDPAVVFTELAIPLIDEAGEKERAGLSEAQLARLESQEKEQSQKLWKWLILGTLVLLIVESWLAGSPGRRRAPSGSSSPLPGTTPAATP